MEKVPLELFCRFADHLEHFNTATGERWSFLTRRSKKDLLTFRSVSRGFRDASWSGLRKILGARVFFLTEHDLNILNQMSHHPRLQHGLKVLTFGGQRFGQTGLQLLDNILISHPSYSTLLLLGSDDAWQLGLASHIRSKYSEIAAAKGMYEKELKSQEEIWVSGIAIKMLLDALNMFSGLHSIRIRPRPTRLLPWDICSSGSTSHPRLESTLFSVSTVRFRAWRDLRRLSEALSLFNGVHDLRLSSISNVGLPVGSPILHPSMFRHLKVAKLSLVEEELVADEVYKEGYHGSDLKICLQNAPHLKSLDIAIKYSNHTNFRSIILAELSREENPCYQLEHLCLESAFMDERDFTRLIIWHASTLKRLILILPWVRPGTWRSLMSTLAKSGIYLDYLEIWKPSQGAISYYQNLDWFDVRTLSSISRKGKVTQFEGEIDEDTGEYLNGTKDWSERWNNCFPRLDGER